MSKNNHDSNGTHGDRAEHQNGTQRDSTRREVADRFANLVTIRQAADMLGVHISSIYRYILSGRLPASKLVGQHRVRLADLEALLEPVEVKNPTHSPPEQRERPAERLTRREQDKRTAEILRKAGFKWPPLEANSNGTPAETHKAGRIPTGKRQS